MKKLICIILVAVMMALGFTNSVRAALIDNGDGTITDDDLGIMWLQEPPPDDVYPGPGRMTWNEAMTWAENLVFAGYDDWRLPSALHFDTGLPDTVWNSINNEWGHLYGDEWDDPYSQADIAPMTGYWMGWYWTSTEDPSDPTQAYAFYVTYDGFWLNDVFPKSEPSLFITAVRDIPVGVPPVALFDESDHTVTVSETITFDASASYDPDGTIMSYDWDFGDGTTATGVIVTHHYSADGTYTVTLTVTDNDGLTDTATAQKTVQPEIPIPEISLTIPVVASLAAMIYLALRKRIGKKLE